MNSCYKVRACCSAPDCDYAVHKDVLQTINHESSFSFSMMLNELNGSGLTMKCPRCGELLYFYPVTWMSEVLYSE